MTGTGLDISYIDAISKIFQFTAYIGKEVYFNEIQECWGNKDYSV